MYRPGTEKFSMESIVFRTGLSLSPCKALRFRISTIASEIFKKSSGPGFPMVGILQSQGMNFNGVVG